MADEKPEQKTEAKPEQKAAAPKAAPSAGVKVAGGLKGKKRKRWYPIVAPKMFDNMMLGETLLDESAQLMGKVMAMSMMNISGDPKKQNINIHFKVTKVQDGKGLAEIASFELQPNSLRRLMRRGRKKIDDSYICRTVDGKYVLVKPMIITSGIASHGRLTDIRKHARELMKEVMHQNTFETLITDLLDYKPQSYLRDVLSKIYPIRTVEIRIFSLTTQTRETISQIIGKGAQRPVEEEESEGEETSEEARTESTEAPVDQMQEIEEERKKKRESDEENPLSEGV